MYDKDSVLNFMYAGENREGIVISDTGMVVSMWDFDRENFRNFTKSKMTNVVVNKNVKIVELENLPVNFDIRDMWRDFVSEGREVYNTGSRFIAVYQHPCNTNHYYNSNNTLIALVKVIGNDAQIEYIKDVPEIINDPNTNDWIALLNYLEAQRYLP
jgi:hypothetical protein